MAHSAEYIETLASRRWRRLRQQILDETKSRCERCWKGPMHGLELHHKHYDTLGEEVRKDVELLCVPCHEMADLERECRVAERAWSARVAGFAHKVWGEDWESYPGFDHAEDIFDDWLQNQEDDRW